ncbi:MAG: TM1802 family CRISPR-associated protein [Elusimicrobiota bacterium]|nr:hypothetical protein [Endomicrobiia bacterium]MDW8166376.1 TM1802 family CRISPR-associated protein [Elusimicrobiota bacterium]
MEDLTLFELEQEGKKKAVSYDEIRSATEEFFQMINLPSKLGGYFLLGVLARWIENYQYQAEEVGKFEKNYSRMEIDSQFAEKLFVKVVNKLRQYGMFGMVYSSIASLSARYMAMVKEEGLDKSFVSLGFVWGHTEAKNFKDFLRNKNILKKEENKND